MKFGKSLNNQIVETLPEWRDKFLSYKDLKKRLKQIGAGAVDGERRSKRQRVWGGGSPPAMTAEEAGFVALLDAELDKFNAFFLEKEEEYVIRQKELQDRAVSAAETGSAEELLRVRKEIVDFHGEMVLLENYSALNYTGLVKILKKYDKRTGALIRLPFIQNVMQEPFFTTDLLYKLVKECEAMLDQLLPRSQPPAPPSDGREDSDGDDKPVDAAGSSLANGALELEEIEDMESTYMKSTVAALRSLREIRSGSSTVSAFSLPPLHGANGHVEEPEQEG
ncbi:SPX domain-containing protein 1-like [Panicum miliaceum]|uniref:SPX domain-containing protein 1-like n=1 Tax=Panicum miliaceum TaxID=4540 RepID=A0A3L6RQB4_PANMI|nr:SPX domain-containing protein 1-like [Panicum miliaceum]